MRNRCLLQNLCTEILLVLLFFGFTFLWFYFSRRNMKILSFFNSLILILAVFSVTALAQTTMSFHNTAPITINDATSTMGGIASPYPSNINVSGLSGNVTDINVRLNGLSHTYLSDIAVLLVAPDTNRRFILLSDCGDNVRVNNITVTFDDQASGLVPCDAGTAGIASGSYQPTSRPSVDGGISDPSDPFAPPAPQPASSYSQPAPTGSATLNNTFGGTNPNGVWSLYIVDSFSGDSGSISGGYSLLITTSGGGIPTPTPTATPTPTPTPTATPTATPLLGRQTAMSARPSPSKSPGVFLSSIKPNCTPKKLLFELRRTNQVLLPGRNTE
jgi:subtilisin-like proprotein convertase family protein